MANEELKAKFGSGKFPTGDDYAELIDKIGEASATGDYVTLDTEQTLTSGKKMPFIILTGPRSETNPDTSLVFWNGGKLKGWLSWATKQNAMEFGISDGDFGIYTQNGKAMYATQGRSLDLGKSSAPWNNLYLKGKINELTLPTGTATLATIDDLEKLKENIITYINNLNK